MDCTDVPENLIHMLDMRGDSCPASNSIKRESGTQKRLKMPIKVLNQKLLETSRDNHYTNASQSMEALLKQETIDESLSPEGNKILLDFLAR